MKIKTVLFAILGCLIWTSFYNLESIHRDAQAIKATIEKKSSSNTNTRKDSVLFEKGAALSFLLGIRKPDTDDAWLNYVNTIFPIASRYDYDPGVAFNVIRPTRGSYHPGFVAVSSWPRFANREQFRKDPDLPKDLAVQRNGIWSRFDQMIIQELDHRIAFEVSDDGIYIFTAYWIDQPDLFENYLEYEIIQMKHFKGRLLARFPKGISPKNHLYDPDRLLISEWPDLAEYEKFRKKVDTRFREKDGLKNIQEFATRYVFDF